MARSRITLSVSLSPTLAGDLKQYCRDLGCSRSAAIQTALRRLFNQQNDDGHHGSIELHPVTQAPPAPVSKPSRRSAVTPPAVPVPQPRLPLTSKFVERVMAGAPPEEITGATERWFRFLTTVSKIVERREREAREHDGINE
jgi:hypothetical protein